MYKVVYRERKNTKKKIIPFRNIFDANQFVKTCIKNNWLILEIGTIEEKTI